MEREGDGQIVERPPGVALRAFVDCYWTREPVPEGGPETHRVLPDGCIDIIFGFPAPSVRSAQGSNVGPAFVVGPMTRPLVVPSTHHLGFLGVRFRPGAAHAFLGVPAAEITDQRLPLDDLWPGSERLLEELTAAPDDASRQAVVDRALLARRAAHGRARDVDHAVRLIFESGGRSRVAEISREVGVTRQQLARRFAQHVGITPKTLCRIVRARSVIARAQPGSAVTWSALAYDAGYFDQSHMVAEFVELTGLTPEEWLAAG
jgi:AraC-like DNA-binding protein